MLCSFHWSNKKGTLWKDGIQKWSLRGTLLELSSLETLGLIKQPWLAYNSLDRPSCPQIHQDPPAFATGIMGIRHIPPCLCLGNFCLKFSAQSDRGLSGLATELGVFHMMQVLQTFRMYELWGPWVLCSSFLRTEIFPPGGRHNKLVKSMRLTEFTDPLLKAL